MKYMRKIDYSQKNQNAITFMQYKNSKSLENSIDSSSIQIFIFSLRLLFVTKEKKFPPAKFPIPPTGGNIPYPLRLVGKLCLW